MANIDDLSISVKSNVTSATNSIDKLITKLGALSASLGQVNTSSFSAMASGIRQISSASNPSSAKNITELANSIKKFGHQGTTKAINNMPSVSYAIQMLTNTVSGINLDSVNGIANISKAINRLGYATADKAVTNIPKLNTQLQSLVITVNSLPNSANGISYLTQLSSALTKLGGKTGTTAIANIPQLTKALNMLIATLSKAPQVSYNTIQLVNALSNLASQGSKVGTASNSIYNGFMRFGKGADHARKKSFSLASAIGKLYAQYWLLLRAFRGIGKGITLASDLTEVQNVVDVAFGEYRSKIEDFADVSIKDYGMSELTAKQIASRYQAMGGAIGFAQGEMADMSIELTKLTADMASFYNVSQEAVAEDLQAIFTGQTRPLREYGLDLTQATLQEWALAQGMKVNIATMTQAEKVLLRYNYVMAQTAMAQGDFQRTQNTWANQIRILKQQFEALGAVIGQNFVYAIKPIVQALNVVMAKLIQFANVVSASLGKIFGWKFEDTTGGIVNDLEFGADAAEDLGGGLGGAADKAKKLRQQLQGFDELNVLTTNQGSSGGGGGGGGFDNEITSTNAGQWVKDTEESLFESDLDSLYKLGDYIGTTLTNQLKSIDWNSVYEGARNFGTGLASFLNGLISPELFSATGSTIAGALNTAIYSTLAFGTEFDFEELGLSIAEGINSFFRDTDFKALGEDIKTWVAGLRTTLITIIKEVEWGDILSGIGDVLGALDAETIITLFGFKALSMLFKRNLFSTLAGALSGVVALPASLTTGLASITSLIFKGFVGSLGAAFVGFKLGEWIYEQISGDETSDINYLDYFLGDSKASASEWWGAVKEYIKNDIVTIEDGSIADAIIDSVTSKSAKEISSKRNGEPSKKIKQLSKDISKYFGSSSKVVDLFAKDYSKDMQDVSSTTETLKENITSKYNNIKENAENSFNFVKNHILGTTDEITKGMANSYNEAAQSIKISSSDTTSDIVAKYQAMRNSVASTTTSMKDSVNSNSYSIKLTSADTTNDIVAKYKAMRESNVTEVNTLKSKAVSALAGINTEGGKETDSLVKKMINQFQSAKDGSNKSFTEMQKSVVSNMNKSKNHISGQNWYGLGGNLVAGLRNGLVAKWSSTSGDGLVGKIVSLASGLTAALKKAFGIHSPSRLWRDDIGYYLAEGLRIGIVDEESNLIGSVVGMGERLTNSLNDSLTIATPSLLNGNYNLGVTSTMAHSYSADNSMSSSVADGVRQGLSASQMEQNALLREQNELLYQILQKESISSDDVYNVVVNKNRDTFNRTGTNPLFA